jgi:hypothetical protein
VPKGYFQRPKPRGRTRRAAEEKQVAIPAPLERACRNFESEVGGRAALIEHVSHAQLNEDQELLIGAIADPRNDQSSLARICYSYGIQFADLLTLFRSAGFAKAQLQAMRRVWERLPDVAGDVMERSVPHQILCSSCAGIGRVEKTKATGGDGGGIQRVEERCDTCNGMGYITIQPRLETQKVALEIGGLLQPGGGPGVQVNVTQQQAMGVAGRLSSFARESDEVLFPQLEAPVDAEMLPSEDEVYPDESDEEG